MIDGFGPGPVYSGPGPVYSGPPGPVYSGPPGPIYSGHGPVVTGGYGLTYDQPGPEPVISSGPPSAGPAVISAGPGPETGGYGLTYEQPDLYKQPSGGYISDEEDLGQQSSPAYGYGSGYGYDNGYGFEDGNDAAFRSRDNRSLTFPEDGSGNDPPRPPKLAAPLPLMAKSDPIETSKPVQFPSDRRSDRTRRQTEVRLHFVFADSLR